MFQPPNLCMSQRFINATSLTSTNPQPSVYSSQCPAMALVKRTVVFLSTMALFQVMNAAIYKVGDSAGWTTIGNIDYQQWAATKTFQVGDTIVFQYNSQFHNVMRVTHAMYRACNASAPLATYTTGNDSFTIKTRGHHFFFCGVPGHCQAGQKVDINVPRNEEDIAPTTTPTPSASSSMLSPPGPRAIVSGPSPSNAISFKHSCNLALSVAVLGFNFA